MIYYFINLNYVYIYFCRWTITLRLKMLLRNVTWTFGDMVTSLKMMPMNLVWENVKSKSVFHISQPHSIWLSKGIIVWNFLLILFSKNNIKFIYYHFLLLFWFFFLKNAFIIIFFSGQAYHAPKVFYYLRWYFVRHAGTFGLPTLLGIKGSLLQIKLVSMGFGAIMK